jgi:hypothetical protein
MPRFEYTVNVHIKKQGKIQIDARNETEAYGKFQRNLDSGIYDEDLHDFENVDAVVDIEEYDIIEGEQHD